jgi:hypothetical protein
MGEPLLLNDALSKKSQHRTSSHELASVFQTDASNGSDLSSLLALFDRSNTSFALLGTPGDRLDEFSAGPIVPKPATIVLLVMMNWFVANDRRPAGTTWRFVFTPVEHHQGFS